MVSRSRTARLKVPGATLHYEVVGAGPVLLLIPGGPVDADGFAPLASALADRYTVVAYDPRGLSRSPFDGEPQDMTVQAFAEDAQRLLAALGTEPAYVLGESSGALVGCELLTHHPEQVRVLVANEPPATGLLDDAAEHVAFGREVYDTYRAQGVGAAMGKFLATAGLDQDAPPPAEATADMAAAMARMQPNLEFFLGHMWVPMLDYLPPVAQLRSLPIVVGLGERSVGQLAHRCALAFAEQLGTEPVVFPGGHSGVESDPAVFADRLDEVLQAAADRAAAAPEPSP